MRLIETHHGLDVPADARVQGRVIWLEVVNSAGIAQPISRVPSGAALRGFDAGDDGHLEAPWTGDAIPTETPTFLVTVRTSR
jgi:hypothetical protein